MKSNLIDFFIFPNKMLQLVEFSKGTPRLDMYLNFPALTSSHRVTSYRDVLVLLRKNPIQSDEA